MMDLTKNIVLLLKRTPTTGEDTLPRSFLDSGLRLKSPVALAEQGLHDRVFAVIHRLM